MIEKAVRDFEVDLGRSWVVGDSQADADLVKNGGLRSVIEGENTTGAESHKED